MDSKSSNNSEDLYAHSILDDKVDDSFYDEGLKVENNNKELRKKSSEKINISTEENNNDGENYIIHPVQMTDTIAGIALRYNVSVCLFFF